VLNVNQHATAVDVADVQMAELGVPHEWPATTVDQSADAVAHSDAPLDDALRALARLLARQAAREIFERECGEDETCSDRLP
jgi:hypothetical protein